MTRLRPPLIAAVAARLVPGRYRDEVLDDLAHEYRVRVRPTRGRLYADVWMLAHAARSGWAIRRGGLRSSRLPRPARLVRHVAADARFAVRLLRRQPLFSAAAVLTLALGIGANTAIYSLVAATLLEPVHVRAPERLVELRENTSYPDYLDYARLDDVFSEAAAYWYSDISLGLSERPSHVTAAFVSGRYFEMLGVAADRGRLVEPSDDVRGAAPVAVVSRRLWRSAFGSDPRIVGRRVRMNRREVTIVGLMPGTFRGTSLRIVPDVWLPLASSSYVVTGTLARLPLFEARDIGWLRLLGRLRDEVAFDHARASIGAAQRAIEGTEPGVTGPVLIPLRTASIGSTDGQSLDRFLWLLAGVVGCSLLVACGNVANMLVARGLAREREFGVRLAIGASRTRLFAQLLTESLVLAALGGAAALVVARVTLDLLSSFHLPGRIAVDRLDLAVDRGALALTFGLTLATGLLFGAIPAMHGRRASAADALRSAGRVSRRRALRAGLVAVQVALCVALLAGGGLFSRGIAQALAIDAGVDLAHVATATVDLGLERYSVASAERYYDEAVARLRAVPGVRAAAWTSVSPLSGTWSAWFDVDGVTPAAPMDSVMDWSTVGPDYFAAIGAPVVGGRPFLPGDGPSAPRVAIVNEAFGRRLLAGADPLGRRVRLGENFRRALGVDDRWAEIVGVVADTRHRGIDEATVPLVYLPRRQILDVVAIETAVLVVRADDPRAALGTIRATLAGLDPQAPAQVATLQARVADTLEPQRLGLTLLGFFGAVALVLSAVGIYGVCAFAVSERRREIGIRVALGAHAGRIQRLIVREMTAAVVAGLAAGLTIVAWSGQFVGGFLYGVSPVDPLTLATVSLVFMGVSLTAAAIPARRASRVDPAEVLRAD